MRRGTSARAADFTPGITKALDPPLIWDISTSFHGTTDHQSSARTASSSCLPAMGLFANTSERASSTSFAPKAALLRRLANVRRSVALSGSLRLDACANMSFWSAIAVASASRPCFVAGQATKAESLSSFEWALPAAIKMLEARRDKSASFTCES